MTTALAYREPHRFSAGLLALLVHLAFFALLYFGVRWQSRPPEEFAVEMWQALPNAEIVPEQPPAPPVAAPTPAPKAVAPAPPPAKAEIELREKQKKKAEQEARKEAAKQKAAAKAKLEKEQRELEELMAQDRADQVARTRAESAAATRTQIRRYEDLIRNKVKRNMKQIADVPDNAEAVFKVTLLPDGSLMDQPVLIKSSGVPAYDEAAARAILLAEPLPVPTDHPELLPMFRELKLSIRP